MDKDIQTVFFDVGNTLRIVLPDKPFIEAAEAELMRLTETKETHDEFFAKLESRWKDYRKLAKTSLLDVSEMELWMQYMLPDYDPELIAAHATRLTRLWRDHDGRRVARPDVRETLEGLDRMGYTMGIIKRAIEDGKAAPAAFLWKMIFTAVTLAVGFKGGEVVPSFFIGAAFGCVFGPLLGLPAGFSAGEDRTVRSFAGGSLQARADLPAGSGEDRTEDGLDRQRGSLA